MTDLPTPSFHNHLHSYYNLRDNYKFKLYHFKTKTYGFNSIRYAGVKLWNSLPVNFKIRDNINALRNV